jgi:putative heme utilization carrier protein HutX
MLASETKIAVKTDLHKVMRAAPEALFEQVAKDHAVTCRQAVEALPPEMRKIAPGSAFAEIMADIAAWGDITFIVHTDDGIFEFSGALPPGQVGGGYFNLAGGTGLHGHLRHERCAAIAFVERPFMGRPSASALFLNMDGGFMFKVFVGRDAQRNLKDNQLARFRELASRLGS